MKIINFLFLSVKISFGFHELLFDNLLSLENLNVSMKLISYIFKESVEIFFKEIMLISENITPLDEHII